MTEAPVRYSTLVVILLLGAAGLVLVAGAATWVGVGIEAGRAAAEKPPIPACASIAPHYVVAQP